MFKGHSDTAILLFALSPSEELRHKNIWKGETLFRALTKRALSEVRKTGLPYFHFQENSQEGTSFGERFSNAIEHLFHQGFQNVIALGNDCPQLTQEHILLTASKLSVGQNVIAPSLDGGFNLLGIQKSTFKKVAFQQLPWQTEHLLTKTLDYFGQLQHQLELLEVLSDVDTISDVAFLSLEIKSLSKALLDLFTKLLQPLQHYWYYTFKNLNRLLFPIPSNKGSPFLLF